MKHLYALVTGLVFGIGISISGMIDPAKVLNFFDIAGTWDPSLAFVMGGALVVTFVGYRLVWRREAPLFGGRFQIPTSTAIDARLIGGSALFGIGWGLVGLCPGPAIASLSYGGTSGAIFALAMLAGMLIAPRAGALLDRTAAAA